MILCIASGSWLHTKLNLKSPLALPPCRFWRTPQGPLTSETGAMYTLRTPSIPKEVSVCISSWPNPIVHDLGHVHSLSTSWITSFYMIVSCLPVLSFNLKQRMRCIEIPHQILRISSWWDYIWLFLAEEIRNLPGENKKQQAPQHRRLQDFLLRNLENPSQ